jgi:hypothetical protein
MVELRCSLDLALAIGAEVPGTRKHLQQLRGDGNMIVIHYADFAPLLLALAIRAGRTCRGPADERQSRVSPPISQWYSGGLGVVWDEGLNLHSRRELMDWGAARTAIHRFGLRNGGT